MEQELKREYTARIAQANKSELVVILFELFVYSIDEAQSYFDKGDVSNMTKYMRKAQGCIAELRGSLNHEYEISANLASLYKYINQQLSTSIARQEPVNFASVKDSAEKLLEAFRQVAKSDNSGSVMENSQQIYAGLTYGKGSLNEVLMNSDEPNRGFKA